MKIDGLAVILAVILMPIILVVTYYIQLEVDTVAKENSYNTKLLDATYDAMSAFELNTANEKLSSVADSLRSIILASNNIFINTLATNLGMSNASKEKLYPYIPAVLYTLYDGYYIYAPTEMPKVLRKETVGDSLTTQKSYIFYGGDYTISDGNKNITINEAQIEAPNAQYGDVIYESKDGSVKPYTTNPENAKTNFDNSEVTDDYVLKSYIQYSARYIRGNIDVTINYTLDNYLNIIGSIGDINYQKTGYLLKKDLINSYNIDGINSRLGQDEIKQKVLGEKTNAIETTIHAALNPSVKFTTGEQISANWNNISSSLSNLYGTVDVNTISDAEMYLDKSLDELLIKSGAEYNYWLTNIQNLKYEIQKYNAIAYYASNFEFSKWVYNNLGSLTYGDIQDNAMRNFYNSSGIISTSNQTDDLYYDFHTNNNVSNRKIFDGSDPENLESNFNIQRMEVIKNSIKYNLNLSISAYCKIRGNSNDFNLPIMLDEEWDKIVNNISIVSFMQGWDCGLDIYNGYQIASSTNNELTVTPEEIYFVNKNEYNNTNGMYHRIDCSELSDAVSEYISFKSKEVKYDKLYDKNDQNFKYKYDHRNLACYTCINNSNNYARRNRKTESYYEFVNGLKNDNIINDNKKLAVFIALGNERQSIYKTNALPSSEGYKITNNFDTNISYDVSRLEITFKGITSNDPIVKKDFKLDNSTVVQKTLITQSAPQTITLDVSNYSQTLAYILNGNQSDVNYVKIIYK